MTGEISMVDYGVFVAGILASLFAGMFYAYKDRNHATQFRFHRAEGKLRALPVALSMLVTFESSIFFLGYPAEVYVHGLKFWLFNVGMALGWSAMLWITIPLFYPLHITSVYEYLYMRYDSQLLRRMVVLLSTFSMTIYAGIVSYGAAIALESVTGMRSWFYILMLVAIATVYTSLGGLKAVIVTDVIQSVVMFGIVFVVLIYGTLKVGGIERVIELTEPSGRLELVDFDPSPLTRHTFWTLIIGTFARAIAASCKPQAVQRLNSTKSINEARKVVYITLVIAVFMQVAVMLQGTVAFAYFSDKGCEPLASGAIKNPNLIMPFTIMTMFKDIPGLAGLFYAALCSASLSTVSSCLSSTSAIISVDFVKPLTQNASEKYLTRVSKLVVLATGIMCVLLGIIVSQIKGPMTQIAGSLMGAMDAPIFAVFVLSMFVKFTTRKGVYVSTAVSFVCALWLSTGYNFSSGRKHTPWLPLGPTDQCPMTANVDLDQSTYNDNITISNLIHDDKTLKLKMAITTSARPSIKVNGIQSPEGNVSVIRDPEGNDKDIKGLDYLYSISYCYFSLMVTVLAVSVGLVVSKVTRDRPDTVPARLLIQLDRRFLTCLPKSPLTPEEYDTTDILLTDTGHTNT